jgi:hypothetical protein
LQFAARSMDTISVGVLLVSTLNHTIFSARLHIRADTRIPFVASVAISGLTFLVGPPPISINCDLAILCLALARTRASGPAELRVILRRLGALLLGSRQEEG